MSTGNRFRNFFGAMRPRKTRRPIPVARPSVSERFFATQLTSVREFTRRTLQLNVNDKPGLQLSNHLLELFELDGVVLYDADLNEVYQAGQWSVDASELAQNAYHFESSDDDAQTGISRRVIRLGSVPIGSLVVRGETLAATNSILASIIAITFDRYRATANEGRIEAEREAEQMRATVLDSLAHAYKTPLTAIRAASSGLSEMGKLTPAQAELVSLIDEQANVLNELTTRLLTTARLGAGEAQSTLGVEMKQIDTGTLIEEVINSMGARASGWEIRVNIAAGAETLRGDGRLLSMLLTQYLDNACKYSDAESAITVRVERSGEEIVLSVHSYGPVISLSDRERIFDRYYRSSSSATRAAGTGIGLSIAKRAAVAHQGNVWVASDEREGTTFFAAIPQTRPSSDTPDLQTPSSSKGVSE